MALESLSRLEDPRRRFESHFQSRQEDDAPFVRYDRRGQDGADGSARPIGGKAAPAVSSEVQEPAATPPINMPGRPTHSNYRHRHDSTDEEAQPSSDFRYAQRVRLENGSRPTLEERLPRLSLNTRPRGRSLLDEINKKRAPVLDDLKQERSALRNVSSSRGVAHEEAISTPTLSASNKEASPPADELLTPQDRLADIYNSPATYTPMSGSPQSAAGSWLCGAGSRPSSFRRRSQRSGTSSVTNSPAAQFLRQYSSSNVSKAPPSPDGEGQEVGDFVLGKRVGSGGFSVVREAFHSSDPSSKATVAVKIIRKKIQGLSDADNEEAQGLLDHEMEIWRTVDHEGILQLNDLYTTDFATFAFMPLAVHGSLFDAVKKVQNVGLELDLVRTYAAQIAETLRYLHQDARIAHRDIKLENFLLVPDQEQNSHHSDPNSPAMRAVLTDFGLSSYLLDDRSAETTDAEESSSPTPGRSSAVGAQNREGSDSAAACGSLHYAAPETLHPAKGKQPPLSPRPDMWAFGVMLFAMITGKRPFANSFEPKLVEAIKAGDCDWSLLDDKCKKFAHASGGIGQAGSPKSDEQRREGGKVAKGSHGGQDYDNDPSTNTLTNQMASAGIAKNDNWARSCNTIIVSDGVDPQAITDVVRGCITVNPEERWKIMRVVESSWLASEKKAD